VRQGLACLLFAVTAALLGAPSTVSAKGSPVVRVEGKPIRTLESEPMAYRAVIHTGVQKKIIQRSH
jgi:hypothetical protein